MKGSHEMVNVHHERLVIDQMVVIRENDTSNDLNLTSGKCTYISLISIRLFTYFNGMHHEVLCLISKFDK
jgi:hypothetical protein